MIRKYCFSAALIVLSVLVFGMAAGQAWTSPQPQATQGVQEPVPPRPLYDTGQFFAATNASSQNLNHSQKQNAPNVTSWNKWVWQSYRDNNWEIYLQEDNSYLEKRLTSNGSVDVEPRLNWDCTRIVFSSNRAKKYNLYSMLIDGTSLVQLTKSGNNTYPAWSADGKRIAYQSDRSGQNEIYEINADGSGQTRLTYSVDYNGQPTWSPDGTKIAFVSYRAGGYRIYVMNADGSGVTQLSTQPYSDHPNWSPDGTMIAYDADQDGDGWQELWLMNADGSNPHQLYKSSTPNTDSYAGGWRPGSQEVMYTEVSWILSNGKWYWTKATIQAEPINIYGGGYIASQWNTEWNPDWQSLDRQPPVTYVNPLPQLSPKVIILNWSADDHNGSGIEIYNVDVRDGPGGVWTNVLNRENSWFGLNTYFVFAGQSGHTYYFRVSAYDNSGLPEPWPADYDAVTTVESLPPVTRMTALPAYSRGMLNIQWSGVDPGGSGVQDYDVQYKDGAAGAWTDWLMATTETSHTFNGMDGHTYYFRCRGRDTALNQESWHDVQEGDARTTLYSWSVNGIVTDNRGVLLQGVQTNISPGRLGEPASDAQGHFTAYASAALTYTVSLVKAGYGSLPDYEFNADSDAEIEAILPPADNGVRNWGFEDNPAQLEGWQSAGVITPTLSTSFTHSGKYAAQLGQANQFSPAVKLTESPTGSSDHPQIVVDGLDGVHMVYFESGLYYRRFENGSWSPKLLVANTATDEFMLFAEQTGALHLVYMNINKIMYTRLDNSGTWSIPYEITSGFVVNLGTLRAALDGQNQLHVIWVDYTSGDDVYYSLRKSDGTWVAAQNISHSAGSSADLPEMALDKNGVIHVMYTQGMVGPFQHYYTQRSTNGAWSTPELIPSTVTYDKYLMVCDETGNVEILVSTTDFIQFYYFIERNTSGHWADPLLLPNQPGLQSSGMKIFALHDKIFVFLRAWTSMGPETLFQWTRSNDNWQGPADINPGTDCCITNFNVDFDDNDVLHLVWASNTDVYTKVVYRTYTLQGSWTPQIVIDSISLYPQPAFGQMDVAVGKDGSIYTAWSAMDPFDEIWDEIYSASMLNIKGIAGSQISQQVTLPVTMTAPTLSLFYQLKDAVAGGSWFDIRVLNGVTESLLLSTTANTPALVHFWTDLSAWSGQTVTLTLATHQPQGTPYISAYLDEISLGSSYPDLWLHAESQPAAALPGSETHLVLTYGNRGGVTADSVVISATLPADLVFESASLTPVVNGNTLSWQVGSLPAGGGQNTIDISVKVKDQAVAGIPIPSKVEIACKTQEVEKTNNSAYAYTFIGEYIFAPILFK